MGNGNVNIALNTRIIFLTITCCLAGVLAYGQGSSLKVMAEVPVQFGLGYEGRLSNRFSLSLQGGILTEPNTTIILNALEAFGTDKDILLLINSTFKFGAVGEVGINYNLRKSYFGGFFQIIALHGGEASTELVENYFHTDITTYPRRGYANQSEQYLQLQSTLYQAGVLFGRRFPLKNEHFEINAEIGVSANVGSNSSLTSDTRQLETLSAEVTRELDYWYSNYAFVPSLSVMFVYKFPTKG